MTEVPSAAIDLCCGVVGCAVGSFLGVVADRLPEGRSLVTPPSHCARCGSDLAWYDNVPVVSYLLLRGRCRRCRTPIGIGALAVEVGAGVGAGLVAAAVGSGAATIGACLWVLTAVAGVALAARRAPPTPVVPAVGTGAGVLAIVTASAAAGTGWAGLVRSLLGLLAAFVAGAALWQVARHWPGRPAGPAGQDPMGAAPQGTALAGSLLAGTPAGALLGWLGPAPAVAGTVVGLLAVVVLVARFEPRSAASPLTAAWPARTLALAAGAALAAGILTSLARGGA